MQQHNNKKDQINYINFIKVYINKFEDENIILGGDFNFYMDRELDKQKYMTVKDNNPAFRQEMNVVLESLILTDCWRIQNPNSRRYTWHSRGKSSRLDYFFISEHLLNNINKCSIETGLHFDHSIVNLELNNKSNMGRSFWKFNNELLHDK